MKGLYIFCFTPPDHCPGVDLAGVGSNSVSCVALPGLSVWAEFVETAPRPTVEAIRRHDAVIRNAWKQAPACLPVRFGQWFQSREALQERVEEQRVELERALTRVTGADEHGIRIIEAASSTSAEQAGPRPSSGRAYLEWLQERTRRQEERERRGEVVGSELETALGEVIRAQRLDPLPPDQGLVSVSHLVPRGQEESYARRLREFQETRPELGFFKTGPWPPYSFGP